MSSEPSEPAAASDAELLSAWSNGDGPSGNALVQRHFDTMYGFFRNKLSGDIDDLIQRTFLAVLRSASRLRDSTAFRRYLFAIARNELYGELRRRLGQPHAALGDSSLDALAQSSGTPTPVSEIGLHAEQVLLLRARRRLPLDEQIALELFYWQGLTAVEVGDVFEQSASGMRSRLQRARQRLEGIIGELSRDARLVESTIDGFERWSASLKPQRPTPRSNR